MSMFCPHVEALHLKAPTPRDTVYREDCTQCFDSIDDPSGLDVCLSCFDGGCTGSRNHAEAHYRLCQHPLVLNIKRTLKPKPEREEPPQKITKVEIAAQSDEDFYNVETEVRCFSCGGEVSRTQSKLPEVIDGIMTAMTAASKTSVEAWQQELESCEHIRNLEQEKMENIDLTVCGKCDFNVNLWLCLTCGNLGCGRAQYGGVGGNSHGLYHFETNHHPVAVKLGSLTADGNADVYCYLCNEERTDDSIREHLATFDINLAERQATEKSLQEMQLEYNLKYDFSFQTGDGKAKPLFGPGLTGLKNLGNTCYMASSLQSLFNLPAFQNRYVSAVPVSSKGPILKPGQDLETQLRKISDGLLSGRYAIPDPLVSRNRPQDMDPSEAVFQKGIEPSMFKALIGQDHAEFSTGRQQDAFELLLHVLQLIERQCKADELEDPTNIFKFALETKLQCSNCKKVRYKIEEAQSISVYVPITKVEKSAGEENDLEPSSESVPSDKSKGKEPEKPEYESVTLKECLDAFTSPSEIEYACENCHARHAVRRTGFKSFPDVLIIHAKKFQIINWVPTKADVPVIVDDKMALDEYISTGIQPGEEELPESRADFNERHPKWEPNADALQQLSPLGFDLNRIQKALFNTGNLSVEDALNWLFEHAGDSDIDSPFMGPGAGAVPPVSDTDIATLAGMGFSEPQAKKALRECGNNVQRAVDWLFSHPDDMGDFDDSAFARPAPLVLPTPRIFGSDKLPANYNLDSIICHKGGSVHSGHYVAFVKKNVDGVEQWVLFNDEKVAVGGDQSEQRKFAYIYFFTRF